ncbi:MAG TPA: hypothetical protein VIX73_11180 [Kofleriaceae bacterium]
MIALLAGCGDNLRAPIAIDDYAASVREAACHYLVRCGEAESVEACLALNVGLLFRFTASERAAVDAGKIVYSAAAARRCVDAIESDECDLSSESDRNLTEACESPLVGALGDGEICAFDGECRSQRCDVPGCGMGCCAGRCVGDTAPVLAGLGQPCPDFVCAAGLSCDFATQRCVPLLPRGASCGSALSCDYGLLCLDHRCQVPPALGAPCDGLCRDRGARCSPTTHTCVPAGLLGDACALGADDPGCSAIYLCDRTGHCSAGIALGQPCGLGDHCAESGAFCDAPLVGTDGLCALPRPNGSPCAFNVGCNSLYCDPFTLLCAPQPVCL